MKIARSSIVAFVIVSGGWVAASHAAEVPTEGSGAAKNANILLNSDVVETDHGQGLGPNGEDLHYNEGGLVESADDTELTRQVLEQPTAIKASSPAEDKLVTAIEGS